MSFRLAADGQSEVTIVCEAAVPPFAADELQTYLAIITGASLPVSSQAPEPRIVLRVTPVAREEHSWRITDTEIILAGSDAGALVHAVYHFLETHCGCRWLSVFEGEEIVPRRETLAVPCEERTFTPGFTHRAFTNYPAIDRRTVSMVDWMAKHGFNRFMIFANMDGSFEAYKKILKPELVARGMKIEMGHHSFRYFLPPEEFFAAHPEYYALLGGERSSGGQVCTSNPEVAEVMARRVCEFLSAHPEIDTVGLWPNDGYGWCECAQCLQEEPQEPSWPYESQPRRTDTYLKFVNRVAEVVAREHADRRLSALAYVNYVQPPRDVTPLPNVKVCFAPFQRCFKHSLSERAGRPHHAEEGHRGAGDGCRRNNAEYARLVEQWRALAPGELYLFEYLMLIDMFSLPYRITGVLPVDLQNYASVGIDGYVLEFKPEEWGAYGVNANLIGALSWDPHRDATEYLDHHGRDLYGAAADEMAAYFAALERDFIASGPCVHHYGLEYTRRATPQLMRPALEHLGRAIAIAARGDRNQREHVQQAQVGAQWLMKVGEWREKAAQARSSAGPVTHDVTPADLTAGRPERRAELVEAARRSGEELLAWAQSKRESGALDIVYIERRIRDEQQRWRQI